MSWIQETATKILEKYPDKQEYVIASGVSPSGFIHIGNFREIVTTYFIGEELKRQGKKVRFILSFDDFDRLRKVPKGFPLEYEKYIGMPYSLIPSPFNKDKTYAQEMEDKFLDELKRLGIFPEVIHQTEKYQNGDYKNEIELALKNRKMIFDILSKYKTQQFTELERDNYYPISLYCERCHKDNTTITSYDNDLISYKCKCGHKSCVDIKKYYDIKLHWKIDWPMRWAKEEVLFEPGGRDHSSVNGSYQVCKEISKKLFKNDAPLYLPYDFIGIKGANGKMASSVGNILTLTDLFEVYDKNIILWFYAKNNPSHAFNIALDDDVIRYYKEYDSLVKRFFQKTLDDNNEKIISATNVTEDYLNYPDFSLISTLLPLVSYNYDALYQILEKEKINYNTEQFKTRLLRASNWLIKYHNDSTTILNEFNEEYFITLNDEEKKWLNQTVLLLKDNYQNIDVLQEKLYNIVKESTIDEKEIKKQQKRYFQIMYNMLLGKNSGPKLSLLLTILDYNTIYQKLFNNEEVKTKKLLCK